jgi:hypothetical protein
MHPSSTAEPTHSSVSGEIRQAHRFVFNDGGLAARERHRVAPDGTTAVAADPVLLAIEPARQTGQMRRVADIDTQG